MFFLIITRLDQALLPQFLFQNFQPREDYREFLELILIFLGETPPRGVRFRVPGAVSKTRWMAAAIYAIKMWLFQDQFSCDDPSAEDLTNLTLFIVKVYARYWFTVPSAVSAPRNDLDFLKKLVAYNSVNSKISKNTVEKFLRHLWYLSEELVCLAFFDKSVSDKVKKSMVKSLSKSVTKRERSKRALLTEKDIKNIKNIDLSFFVTSNSLNFFKILGIPRDFLKKNPNEWPSLNSFQKGLNIIKHLKVINDSAERAVALIQTFNETITTKEDQKQFLLKVVSRHRKKYPTPAKKFL